jgi:hypothetical protein
MILHFAKELRAPNSIFNCAYIDTYDIKSNGAKLPVISQTVDLLVQLAELHRITTASSNSIT